jgi:serine/threonine-protein kinase RsbT
MVERAKAELAEQIVEALSAYVSKADAQALLARSMRSAGISGQQIGEGELAAVLSRVQTNVGPYLPVEKRADLAEKLRILIDANDKTPQLAGTELVQIRSENDIVVARTRARIMCEMMRCKGVSAHKVATVVSELARNIVSYTSGGTIELTPSASPPSMTIRAVDTGTGIKNLDAIMNGSYRSKTGLGLGLSGSKRLATHFEIDSGANGTTILVKMKL